MSFLSTGPIENNATGGLRPTQQVTVKIDNRSNTMSSMVTVEGYYLDGVRTLYVSETLNVLPNQVLTATYYADLDAFEFVFVTSGTIDEQVQVSVWGKSSACFACSSCNPGCSCFACCSSNSGRSCFTRCTCNSSSACFARRSCNPSRTCFTRCTCNPG